MISRSRRRALWPLTAVFALAAGLVAPSADAAPVPKNGPIIQSYFGRVFAHGSGFGQTKYQQIPVSAGSPNTENRDIALSPDGRWLAVTGGRTTGSGPYATIGWNALYVGALGGDSFKQLTFFKSFADGAPHPDVSAPDWAPDSRRLVFVHNGSLWTIDTQTRAVHRLTVPHGMVDGNPRWSPNGRQIVFTRAVSLGGDPVVGTKGALYLVKPDGTSLRKLTQGTTADGDLFPDWSPDGQRILFVRYTTQKTYYFPGQASQLMTVSLDGRTVQALTTVRQSEYFRWPTWSPDGRLLVVNRLATSGNNVEDSLAVYDADGHFQHWVKSVGFPDTEHDYMWGLGLTWAPASVLARLPKA